MRKSLWIIALLFAAIGAPTVLRAQTTYTVDETFGFGGSVMGTITTDGNTGTLGVGDILSWNLTLNDGAGVLQDTSSDPAPYSSVEGSDLTATATGLFFDFTGGAGALDLADQTTDGQVCFLDAYNCDNISTTNGIDVDQLGISFESNGGLSGTQEIATLTPSPEPSTAILWLTGIGLMILMRKRIAQTLQLDTGTHGSLSPH
jgi:hypothetical protein